PDGPVIEQRRATAMRRNPFRLACCFLTLAVLAGPRAAGGGQAQGPAGPQPAQAGPQPGRTPDHQPPPGGGLPLRKARPPQALRLLRSLPKLRKVNLLGDVTDDDLALLAPMSQLRELYLLYRCRRVTDKGIKHVAKLTGLRALCLHQPSITDDAIALLEPLEQ